MEKYKQFGTHEMLALGLLVTNSMIFSDLPQHYFITTGNAAPLAAIISWFTAMLFYLLIGLALEKYPGQGLHDLSVLCLGKCAGTLFNLALAAFFALLTAATVRHLAEAIVMTVIPQVPISVLVACVLLLCIFAAWRGFNALAKSCYVALPFLAVGVIILLLFSVNFWQVNLLFPLLGLGLKPVMLRGLFGAASFGDLITLAVLAGSAQIGVPRLKPLLQTAILSGILFFLVVTTIGMAFPYPAAAEMALPYFMVSRTISLGFFLQRLEALFLIAWTVAIILKIAISFSAGLFLARKTLAISDGSPLVLPYAGMVFAIAMIPNSYLEFLDLSTRWLKINSGLVTMVIPALIALIGLWKARAGAKSRQEEAA